MDKRTTVSRNKRKSLTCSKDASLPLLLRHFRLLRKISERLLASLETAAPPKDREEEAGQGESALSPTIRRVITPTVA